jgi:uncharacterized protein YjbI with pentapeptide repeats
MDRNYRAPWLLAVAAMGGLSVSCSEAQVAPQVAALSAGCTQGATRDVSSLSEDNPLCETQTLMGGLEPGRVIDVPLVLSSAQLLSTCMIDDNSEKHSASLIKNGEVVFTLEAGAGCQDARRIEAGTYTLRLRHVDQNPNAADGTPDVVYTSWQTVSAPGAALKTQQLVIQVNACPGCNFARQPWPVLSTKPNGTKIRGFVGNYAGANFSESTCTSAECILGNDAMDSNFAGANFGGVQLVSASDAGRNAVRIGSKRTGFDGANFSRMVSLGRLGSVIRLSGSFRRTNFSNADLELVKVENADFTEARFDDFRLTWYGIPQEERPALLGMTGAFSVSALRALALSPMRYYLQPGAAVAIEAGASLDKLVLDGAVNKVRFSLGAAPARLSFVGSRLSNIDFPCEEGSLNFAGTNFSSADLTQVNLAFCNLSGAKFNNAMFRQVSMARSDLVGASFESVTIDGLDLSSSSVRSSEDAKPGLLLVAKAGTIVKDLNLSDARAALLSPRTQFSNLIAFRANLSNSDFSQARLENANLSEAQLDGVKFTSASIRNGNLGRLKASGADFSQADLSYANLDEVDFNTVNLAANFENASLEAALLCGSTLTGATFPGANLRDAVAPATATKVTKLDGKTSECGPVIGLAPIPPATSKGTTCPNGRKGPCALNDWQVP